MRQAAGEKGSMAEEISFHLEKFEGPLDLLLHLIEKNKVSIFDIPISEITDQYIAYVGRMQTEDLGVMSEFLLMASTLLEIKARMLLPREKKEEEDEEEDPRRELAERLFAYKKYKLMASELENSEYDALHILYHDPEIPEEVSGWVQPPDLDALFHEVTLSKLRQIFEQVMRQREDRTDPERSRFGTIRRERVSMREKVTYLLGYAKRHRSFSFRSILKTGSTRTDVVVTFLAVLELMKAGKIRAHQEEPDGDISIEADERAIAEEPGLLITEESGG